MKIKLADVIRLNKNEFSDDDVSVLADWANGRAYGARNPHWKRAYALIREGADLLLRRRASAAVDPEDRPEPAVRGWTPDIDNDQSLKNLAAGIAINIQSEHVAEDNDALSGLVEAMERSHKALSREGKNG
jgi:hypothetical protein